MTAPSLVDPLPVSWAEVETYLSEHDVRILDEHRGLEGWTSCLVDPAGLRDMHGTFGRGGPSGFNIDMEKGRTFGVLFDRFKERIDRGDFPAVADIRRSIPDKPAITVQRTIHNGELYVCDGEMRTFNALYHAEPLIRAFVIDYDERRDVL